LAATLGVGLGGHGRIRVGRALQLSRHPEVFAVGDLAEIADGDQALPC
jgi:NADH dehydrogenase FAD-containing subunit